MQKEEIAEVLGRIEKTIAVFNEQVERNGQFMESFGIGFATALAAICEALIANKAVEREELINWLSAADMVLEKKSAETGILQEADVHRKGFAYLIGFLREKTIQRH